MGIVGTIARNTGALAARAAAAVAKRIVQRLNPMTIAREVDTAIGKMVSHGASEVAHAIHTGNAFVHNGPAETNLPVTQTPPATPTVEPATQQVHAPVQQVEVIRAQPAPWGHPAIGHSDGAKIIDMQPQLEARNKEEFQKLLESAAANQPDNSQKQARGRKA